MEQVAVLEVGVGYIVHEPNHALFDYPPVLALIVIDVEEVVLVEVELCAVAAEVQVQMVGGYHQMPVVEVVVVVVEDPHTNHHHHHSHHGVRHQPVEDEVDS